MKYETTQMTVGDCKIGGNAPVLIQSMTTTTTTDIEKTVAECIRIYKAGAEMVRITAQGVKEAEALQEIKASLKAKGYTFPLSADIHFNYKAAYTAAKYVDKVRINPGNFVKHNENETFEDGIERIKERFVPLLDLLKQNKVALRIGVNHGSLSERMTMKYGDTPKGIVASCMEYLEICKAENFHNLVISIKSSNTVLMIKAVRLLVVEMQKKGMAYPLHLGVTEAGEGEDGRLKSAVGIGTLLNQGLGDTIRVSLTEPPEFEPPVAKKIVAFTKKTSLSDTLKLDFSARKIQKRADFSNLDTPRVLISGIDKKNLKNEDLGIIRGEKSLRACDYILLDTFQPEMMQDIKQIIPFRNFEGQGIPLYECQEYFEHKNNAFAFVQMDATEIAYLEQFTNADNVILWVNASEENSFKELEQFFQKVEKLGLELPVVVGLQSSVQNLEDLQIQVATSLGNSFVDKLASGIFVQNDNLPLKEVRETAFGVLQASRARTTKTEFISCPGCGRTLFSLQEVTGKVKEHFKHLNHLKIGVMGCIVNGPGEMGDAHYGYVGAGQGKINLYKGMEVMQRNIPFEKAIGELEKLIKEHGDWIEPNEA
ncbi:MAG: (E)-4-hydroxy-3-methylbut-2-enyl-diphosphate synthase [Flavobacteriaceae bacterium]|nr:(E)-4-hydroxy-3-methylbut-2-enyl-diphosphate synthase [Flavobacteriaceae bacterium]